MRFSKTVLLLPAALVFWAFPIMEAHGEDDLAPKTSVPSQLAKADEEFLHRLAQGGMMKARLGEIAGEKGTTRDIKETGATLAKEHNKANQELQEIAEKRRVILEKELNAQHRELIDRVTKLTGEKFDKAFVSEMIRSHEKGLAILEKSGASVKDADLKAFAAKRLPVLKVHLQKLEALKKGEG